MSYTHGYTLEDEFRVCGCCGKKLPQTEQYFNWAVKNVRYTSTCKECNSKKAKERNKYQKELKDSINRPIYNELKECICCHRKLPYDWMHFPTDKTTKTGLRNKCRECTLKSGKPGKFLSEDSKIQSKWTKEENEILIEYYKDYTGEEIKNNFLQNRTVRAIECQASLLGLQGKTYDTYKRSRDIASQKVSVQLKGRALSDETKQKISETKKEYFKNHDGWWKGKKRSEEQRKQISERMKGKWAGENNPRYKNHLNGELNGRWKGGINKTYVELRTDTRDWQLNSMEFCKYKCIITGSEFDNVHHIVPFRDIVDEVFNITNIEVKERVMDYSNDEFELLRNTLKELHIKYGYGACINEKVHKLFHDTYGYTEFNCNMFLDFINKIKSHIYDDWFKGNNLEININEEYVNYLIKQFGVQTA